MNQESSLVRFPTLTSLAAFIPRSQKLFTQSDHSDFVVLIALGAGPPNYFRESSHGAAFSKKVEGEREHSALIDS